MPVELQSIAEPTVITALPPRRGGRYQVEFPRRAALRPCGHRSAHALLWLIFLESDEEAGREVTDVICSTCEPARYARVRAWASALA